MSVIAFGRGTLWRRAASCVVVYAFALHLVLLGVAAPAFALSADQDSLAGVLCVHDEGSAPPPAHDSGKLDQCQLCTAACHPLLAQPAPVAHAVVIVAAKAVPPADAWFIPRAITHRTPQPRGPPRTA
jgi:hypothetical protein